MSDQPTTHSTFDPSERLARKVDAAKAAFFEQFGPASTKTLTCVRGPGRVNLIGEHTDYNDGYVFPMAIDREVVLLGRARADQSVRLYSIDYRERVEFDLDRIESDKASPWSNYFRGVVDVLQKEGLSLRGLDAVVTGDVPQGAGLSSSAAFEVASCTLLNELFGLGLDAPRRALLAQRAENQFVGVNCGIMDQFASALARAGHGLFLDCRTLEVEHVPLHLGESAVVVINTNKQRGLVDSEYNTRRRECEAAAAAIAQRFPGVRTLRDVTGEQFAAVEETLPEPVRRRARHVVGECDRVLESVAALRRGDLAAFGRLMDASHESLRRDFEVSCVELDAAVEIARRVDGVYGARMTGGGFGGCAVALVRNEAVEEVRAAIFEDYPRLTGLQPDVYVFGAAGGAGVVQL